MWAIKPHSLIMTRGRRIQVHDVLIVTRSIVLYVVCFRSLFVFFPLVIVLSVILRFMDSGYPFGIFKLFLTVTRRVSLMELKLDTFSENQSTSGILMGSYCFSFLCSVYIFLFLLAIALSVLWLLLWYLFVLL